MLKTITDASIDAVVTDPPYELGFMGRAWDRTGIAYDVAMWAECLRVLKPGGHLLAFSAARTYHRMACAIEDAGFELRDQIMWIYGSGFPKSKNLDGDWSGWGTALKPAHEPICVARKPLVGTVAANVLEHRTGALNIDACRVHGADALGGQYIVKRFAPGASVNADGNWKQNVEYTAEMKAGRWPANVIHDGSPDVLEAFARFGEKTSGTGAVKRASSADGQGNAGAAFGAESRPAGTAMISYGDSGSAARFFYCAKASRTDRNEGLDDPGSQFKHGSTLRDAENLGAERKGNHHPTVKPTELMAYLCRLVTPPGGVVLDPFMGSGSTGKACAREGFGFVGIDDQPAHVEIARARVEYELARVDAAAAECAALACQQDLFADAIEATASTTAYGLSE
ncbi:DNA-methyltransferase [Burkholderia sp. AU32262]|uniref:DNA-methyltransferase n=1 Tax=Burkholderia sp. AU32262 TaxID=2879630 RepID=UPI001CF4B7BA|nr:site-specific DNA-methyltransferase [Burkholderia sp. AU32262]MCA8242853.1 site-specific DNA-methyltransferase [Burkholderia sp. AU32262]